MDLDPSAATEGGIASLIVGAIVAWVKARDSKRDRAEKTTQELLSDRMAFLEKRLESKDQLINTLTRELSEARTEVAKMHWVVNDLRDDLNQAHKEISVLKDQFIGLYSAAGMPKRLVKP